MPLLHQIILHVPERIFYERIFYVSERIFYLITAIDDKIRDEKLQYDINKEVAKISALSSDIIDKYEYLTSEEILPFNQRHHFLQTTS